MAISLFNVILGKEVNFARIEANDTMKYLKPLSVYLSRLQSETNYEAMTKHFHPIIHVILLIWKSSGYYNTPSRLTIMLRLLSNSIIKHTVHYLNNESISVNFIDAQPEAIRHLTLAIKVLNKCKDIFSIYQEKSFIADNPYISSSNTSLTSTPMGSVSKVGNFASTSKIGSFSSISANGKKNIDNMNKSAVGWKISNNAIFYKLDLFIERCYDLLDISKTIQQFNKLSNFEIGGTKGKTLTATINQIYNEFISIVESIKVKRSLILDYENKDFNAAFYEFCNRIKELDRRLSSVIVQGFDDVITISGKFKLLDTFDNLTHRPIIADALEKKYSLLIELIQHDIKNVQAIFNSCCDDPPITNNLPPIAGALTWSRGLIERMQGPIEKLNTFETSILEREDVKETLKLFNNVINQINEFNRRNIETWGQSIEVSSQVKLKNPILRRDFPPTMNTDKVKSFGFHNPFLLFVNFDPLLVRLLREVKYFLLLGLQVPDCAMDIYSLSEVYRRYTGNLELIVNMYNDIQTSLLPVERPLLKSQLEHIDKTLAQGIGASMTQQTESMKGNMKNVSVVNPSVSAQQYIPKVLNWKSSNIDAFINEVMVELKEATDILQSLKACLRRIEQIVDSWKSHASFDKGNKTLLIEEFSQLQQNHRQSKLSQIKESGQEIHRIMKEINKKLKVSQGLPDWKAYIDFINNFIIYGLTDAITLTLKSLAINLNYSKPISNNENSAEMVVADFVKSTAQAQTQQPQPLVEIQLSLANQKVVFIPEIGYNITEFSDSIPHAVVSNSLLHSPPGMGLSINTSEYTGHGSPMVSLSANSLASTRSNNQMFKSFLSHKNSCVKSIIQHWINGILGVTSSFKRLDTAEGSFLHEVSDSPKIHIQRSKILQYIDLIEVKCNVLREQFSKYRFLWLDSMHSTFNEFLSLAVVHVKIPFIVEVNLGNASSVGLISSGNISRTSSKAHSNEFFSNNSSLSESQILNEDEYWIKTVIDLSLFGDKISFYTDLQSEVSEMKNFHEIDFLKINAQPIKNTLDTYSTKWLYLYTHYLIKYVSDNLSKISTLITNINQGLDITIENNDRNGLMQVMKFISDVRKRSPEIQSLFEPIRSIISLFKSKNIPLDLPPIADSNISALDFLEQAPMQWEYTSNKAYRVKEFIQPLQNTMLEGVKKDIKLFEQSCLKLLKEFLQNGPNVWVDFNNLGKCYHSINLSPFCYCYANCE